MKLLNDNNIDFDVVEYLKDPLSENEILVLAKKLGRRPKDFIRTSEKDFKDSNDDTKVKTILTVDKYSVKVINKIL